MNFFKRYKIHTPTDQKFKSYFRANQVPEDKGDQAKYLEYLSAIEDTYRESEDSKEVNAIMICFVVLVLALLTMGPNVPLVVASLVVLAIGCQILVIAKLKTKKAVALRRRITASEVKHAHAAWKNKADTSLKLEIIDSYWQPDFYIEKLEVKKTADNTYKLCCIPFTRTDLNIGDAIKVNGDGAVQIVERGNYASFRIATKSKVQQDNTITALKESDVIYERFNSNLLLVAIEGQKTSELAEILGKLEQDGTILEYQHAGNKVNKVSFSKSQNIRYGLLFITCLVLQVAGMLVAMHFARKVLFNFFATADPSDPSSVSFPLTDRLFILSGFVLACCTLLIQNRLLNKTIFLKRKTSRSEREVKSYVLAAMISALCTPIFPLLFFVAFIFISLAANISRKKPLSGSKVYWNITLFHIVTAAVAVTVGWMVLFFTTSYSAMPGYIDRMSESSQGK